MEGEEGKLKSLEVFEKRGTFSERHDRRIIFVLGLWIDLLGAGIKCQKEWLRILRFVFSLGFDLVQFYITPGIDYCLYGTNSILWGRVPWRLA